MAGYFIHSKTSWFPLFQLKINYPELFLLLFSLALIMGSSFVLNQLKDIESDKKNKKLFIISNGILSSKTIWWEVVILSLVSISIAFFINLEVGIFTIFFFIITGVLYNFSPTNMKDRPWGSLLANGLMGWLAFGIGWVAKSGVTINLFIESIPYVLFNTALYLFTILPDREGDKNSGKKTLAVLYNIKFIIRIAFIIYSTGFLLSLWLYDKQALVFYILSLPFFLKALGSAKIEDTIRATKYGILFFALSICLRWPVYLILMILGFFSTKFYFRKRFNFNYPNFSGK
jgi:4-hydroxybenzoate polyprenyltransferase